MTMLSGPAASVAGALMHLKVTDGIYFEVGGTSTNVGVIRNGRPTVAYAHVGGHETYVSSLDVRVLGIAGGSLIRVRDGDLVDVGPRSAHIAGLPYAAFAEPEDISSPRVVSFRPREGDTDDYVAIETADGPVTVFDPAPSAEDQRLTRDLVWAAMLMGIQVLDHLIIGNNRYFSFADQGIVKRFADAYHRRFDNS